MHERLKLEPLQIHKCGSNWIACNRSTDWNSSSTPHPSSSCNPMRNPSRRNLGLVLAWGLETASVLDQTTTLESLERIGTGKQYPEILHSGPGGCTRSHPNWCP